MFKGLTNNKGFTLIEIIAVLVILGILVSVAAFNYSDDDNYSSSESMKVNLRYAQARSMNSDADYSVIFNVNSYSLVKDASGKNVTELFPGEADENVDFPGNLTGSVTFDSWGRPSGISTIIINSVSIIITEDTGFIK